MATAAPDDTSTAASGAGAALGSAVAFVVGFLPWIVYWILVGNASFVVAVSVALALAVAVNLVAVARHAPLMVLEVGSAIGFAVFLVLALTVPDATGRAPERGSRPVVVGRVSARSPGRPRRRRRPRRPPGRGSGRSR